MQDEDCLTGLTPKQRECLELVLQQMTSKQIAQQLGISPFTVNQRLDAARRKLGAITRQDGPLKYGRVRGIPESLAYHRAEPSKDREAGLVKVCDLPERALYQPFMLANQQGSELNPPYTDGGPDLLLAEAPSATLARSETVPDLWQQGAFTAYPTVFWRLCLVVLAAALIMVLILAGVATAHGLTSIFGSA